MNDTQNILPQTEPEAKRPGRHPKAEMQSVKKGNSSWKPANVLDVFDKEPGYRYRIVEKSPRNLAKKIREGWEIQSGLNKGQTGIDTGNSLDIGKSLTSVMEGHDYVIARMPEEVALERDAYMNAETDRRTSALLRTTKQDLGKTGAAVHGSISIEKRGTRTVIKD